MLLWSALLLACTTPAPRPAPRPTEAPLELRTTSFPVDWLVRRLAPSGATVTLILPAGEDPPDWQPPGPTIEALQHADLVFAHGANYEGWMATSLLPDDRVVYASAGQTLIELGGAAHQHGAGPAHSHAGVDPHVWADPVAYLQEAGVVAQALRERRPAQAEAVTQREAALKQSLEALDADLGAAWAPWVGVPLSASHPAFNYVARRYGLSITSFGFDPAEPPTPEALAEWAKWAEAGGRHLLWEAAPTAAVTAAFPSATVHVVLDPLEQPPEGGRYDYLAQARKNISEINKIEPVPQP